MSKRKPPVIKLLGNMCGVRRLTDKNLETLHDLCLIALLRCQEERSGVAWRQ